MESKFNMKATAGTKQDFKKRVDGVGLKDNVTGHWILIAEAMGEPAITLNCWTITRQILVGEKKKKKSWLPGYRSRAEQINWATGLRETTQEAVCPEGECREEVDRKTSGNPQPPVWWHSRGGYRLLKVWATWPQGTSSPGIFHQGCWQFKGLEKI